MVGGRFKGFAFVEFEDYRDAKVLIRLHFFTAALTPVYW
jgi:hypothetical protein